MTRTVLAETSTGAVVVYDESPEEREARIERQSVKAAKGMTVTSGQAQALARAQRAARRRARRSW